MADSVQEYQEFASDFTGSVASLQQETCLDFVPDEIPSPVVCPTCTPDPNAVVPDWTTERNPFLNKQTCQYYVTITTNYTDVGGEELASRYKEFAPVATRRLLRFFNKLETDLVVDTLVNGYAGSGPVIQGKDWFLPFQLNARLKLLYIIDAFNFDGLAADTEDPDAFGQEPVPSSNEVTLDLSILPTKLDRLTRIFTVYSKFQAALRNIDNGSIMHENSNKEFIIGDLNDSTSLLYEISVLESTLNGILSDNNFAEFGFYAAVSSIFSDIRNANFIKFGFTDQYVLDKITIIEEGCPDVVIEGVKLERYSDESPLNNPTVIAYLSRLEELYDATMAIDAPEWTDIILEYTYPSVTINYGENTLFDDEESLAECIASAVSDYGKTLSNRALNLLYSYPDIVADRLNKYLCTDVNLEEELTAADILAQEKAEFFKKLNEAILESEAFKTAQILLDFQLRMLKIRLENNGKVPLNKLFEDILDDYGWCGFLALFQGLLACIAYGFSWEELAKKIVQAGLNELNPLQMSKFLVLLPPDKQAEVILKVDQVLQENDIVSQFFDTFDTSGVSSEEENAEFEAEKEEAQSIEDELNENIKLAKSSLEQAEAQTQALAVEQAEAEAAAQAALQAESASAEFFVPEAEQAAVETLESEFKEWNATNILAAAKTSAVNSRKQLGSTSFGDTLGQIQTIVMQAYIDAFLELVNIDDLYNALLKFPGVKIIAQLINAANCPTPDDNAKVTWLNFLNTLEIEWCKLHFDITLPPLPTIPDLSAFFSALWRALGQVAKELIVRFITQVFYEILLKLLEMLINGLCQLIGTLAEAAAAALTGGNPTTAFLDLLRETFGCPPIESTEQEEALLEAVAQIFGGQSGTTVTTEEVASFMQNASSALTSYELVDLLKGKLSSNKARYLKEFLRLTDPRLSSLFPNESSLTSLFSTLGNLIPNNILQDYEDRATASIEAEFPANTSVCGTPSSIDKFRKLREDILSNKGLSDDEIKHQIDGMQDRADENLKFLVDLATKGVGNLTGEKLAAALLGPDSLTNPISALSTPECSSSTLYGSAFSSTTVQAASSTANDILFNGLKTAYLNDLFREPSFFQSFGNKPVAFLNAVLADKSGRDFVLHNKRTNDFLGRIYNDESQQGDYDTFCINISEPKDSYFPITVSKLTQDTLKESFVQTDAIFSIQTSSYGSEDSKRSLFKKKEDYTITIDTQKAEQQQDKYYSLLYSQSVLSGSNISSNNISRFAVIEGTVEKELNLIDSESALDVPEGLVPDTTKGFTITRSTNEIYKVIYQSKFDLDDGIKTYKDQYMPATLTYSPQADSFLSYIQQKIDLGEYSSVPTVNVDVFNNISDKSMKWIISTLTDDEAYKFGYEYEKEKITIEDLELDPETLERKTNNPRIQFLDYTKYGGTEDQPPIYIKPATRTGWLGVADSIIPELTCTPEVEKIVDFESLKSLLSDLQSTLSDDPALRYAPDCRELVPYLKPLSAEMAAKLQVAIVTTMRIYISEAILRCIPLYNKFVVSYDKIIDELYFDYIIRKLEDGLTNQGEGLLNIVNDEYYLRFLEQSVQIVGRKKLAGEIELTDTEQNALDSINKMIRDFYFVKEKDASFLEQLNSVLGDLKEPTLKLMFYVKNETTVEAPEKYETFIEILNSKTTDYPELASFASSIPTLYDTYYNSADENGIASNSSINALVKELKALLSSIGTIQNETADSMDDMLSDVMKKLNEKSILPPTLKAIRREMVYEGIRKTKYEAKILMRKILKDEFNSMASSFATNIYTGPEITNIRKYFLDADDKLILRNVSSSYFDVAAIPASGNNPLSAYSDVTVGTGSISISGSVDYIDNPNGYFILERYIKLQDRELPLSGTAIPTEITARPDHINGVINVYAFKDWISTLSDSTRNTEMFKLFGDLSVSGTVESGYELTGSTLGVKYGLRLSYVPSATTFTSFGTSNASVNENKAYSLSSVSTLDGRELKNSSYIIPVVSAEIDLIDDLLGNFDPDSGLNLYNHDCLVKELYESSEFRFLFYYCFPLQKYMSANCAFISETYVNVIGLNDGWSAGQLVSFNEINFKHSKEASQIFFDIYYNWDDYEYKNSKLNSLLNGPDNLLQSISSFLRPVAAGPWFPFLQPFLSKIVPRRPYDEEGNDCDVIDR